VRELVAQDPLGAGIADCMLRARAALWQDYLRLRAKTIQTHDGAPVRLAASALVVLLNTAVLLHQHGELGERFAREGGFPRLPVRKQPVWSRPFPAIHRITLNVGSRR
jgi:hypothetical protein